MISAKPIKSESALLLHMRYVAEAEKSILANEPENSRYSTPKYQL